MQKTNIEYLTHSWSPIAMRCTPVSEGCKNCWHLALANRLAKNPMISKDRQKAYAGGEPVLIEKELHVLGRKMENSPIIGVQFMGDLFHSSIPFEWIAAIFGIMLHSNATFLVLTKRPKRMLEFFEWIQRKAPARRKEWIDVVADAERSCNEPIGSRGAAKACGHEFVVNDYAKKYVHSCSIQIGWPLKNVYIGVTCENQATADERIPILLQIPATVRFVSCEPLLSEINLEMALEDFQPLNPDFSKKPSPIQWVIVGGESGPGAGPMHPDWARSIRNQCQAAGVNFFFKQWGAWCPDDFSTVSNTGLTPKYCSITDDGRVYDYCYQYGNIAEMMKVGKKKAGRILDGRTWDEYPDRSKKLNKPYEVPECQIKQNKY